MKYIDKIVDDGRAAYAAGATTVEQAKKANPYIGFGAKAQHQMWISWNHGWNLAKKESVE
jgi:hypothetical protein